MFDDPLTDGKSQPGTPGFFRQRLTCLSELFKYARQTLCRYTDSGITDTNYYPLFVFQVGGRILGNRIGVIDRWAGTADLETAVAGIQLPPVHLDVTPCGEFDRIGKQIVDDLLDALGINL